MGVALVVTLACGSNDVTEPTGASQVTRAGWSFGFCLGACRGDLEIDGERLDYRVSDRDGAATVVVNHGSFTVPGRERLAELSSSLAGAPLQAVYGCPDCADGGSAYVELLRAGARTEARYEYRRPPVVLQSLDEFLADVMEALGTCTATSAVQLEADCQPLAR